MRERERASMLCLREVGLLVRACVCACMCSCVRVRGWSLTTDYRWAMFCIVTRPGESLAWLDASFWRCRERSHRSTARLPRATSNQRRRGIATGSFKFDWVDRRITMTTWGGLLNDSYRAKRLPHSVVVVLGELGAEMPLPVQPLLHGGGPSEVARHTRANACTQTNTKTLKRGRAHTFTRTYNTRTHTHTDPPRSPRWVFCPTGLSRLRTTRE